MRPDNSTFLRDATGLVCRMFSICCTLQYTVPSAHLLHAVIYARITHSPGVRLTSESETSTTASVELGARGFSFDRSWLQSKTAIQYPNEARRFFYQCFFSYFSFLIFFLKFKPLIEIRTNQDQFEAELAIKLRTKSLSKTYWFL